MEGIQGTVWSFNSLKLTSAGLGGGRGKAMVGRCTNYGCSPLCNLWFRKQQSIIRESDTVFGGKRPIYHLGPISILAKFNWNLCRWKLAIKFCGGMGSCTTVKMTKINHNQLSKCPGSCEASQTTQLQNSYIR